MRCLTTFLIALYGLSALSSSESAKILAIFPFPGPSQYILVQPYLKTLAARGHEVSVINAFPQKAKIPNFHDISVVEIHKFYDSIIVDFMEAEFSKWGELNFITDFAENVTLTILKNPAVQQLLHSSVNFDLIIVETLMIDPVYGIAQHFNAPLIGLSSFGTDPVIDDLVGNVSPVSYTPLVRAGFTDRMNFWERLQNLALITLEHIHLHTVHLPRQNQIYKQYFPNAKVELSDLRKNFSLILLNQHFTLSFARPYVPNMIEVGGLHLNHKPAPLPTDMAAFINASTAGVIYFSLGSNIKSKDLPKEKLDALMRTFAELPQSMLWKFEDPDLPGKPKNVFISKWFPQPDILAHPKVKLFITHGGLLSTIEAIYHGKPVVGMPVFYDQFLNVERAKQAGFGLYVDFHKFDASELKSAIMEVLHNPSYAAMATKMSQRYRDQPMTPLETAIYWTEYVLRHDGAPHMRNAGQDLSFIQLHSLDTITVLFVGLALAFLLSIWLVFRLIAAILNKSASGKQKQKRH